MMLYRNTVFGQRHKVWLLLARSSCAGLAVWAGWHSGLSNELRIPEVLTPLPGLAPQHSRTVALWCFAPPHFSIPFHVSRLPCLDWTPRQFTGQWPNGVLFPLKILLWFSPRMKLCSFVIQFCILNSNGDTLKFRIIWLQGHLAEIQELAV